MTKMQIWKTKGITSLVVAAPKAYLLRKRMIESNAALFAEFEAENWLEAYEKYNAILGFGPYRPILKENGEPEFWYFTKIRPYGEK